MTPPTGKNPRYLYYYYSNIPDLYPTLLMNQKNVMINF